MEIYMAGKQLDNKRYERKYFLESEKMYLIKDFLIQNMFTTLYNPRKVNSIYFDTKNLKYFRSNVEGDNSRIKVRTRWYGNQINKKKIEIKLKKGFIGEKKYLEYVSDETLKQDIFNLRKDIVYPAVKVQYEREYFISTCNKFRATLDTKISSHILRNGKSVSNSIYSNQSILEFKYTLNNDNHFRKYINSINFPFRYKKNSKYVNALLNLRIF